MPPEAPQNIVAVGQQRSCALGKLETSNMLAEDDVEDTFHDARSSAGSSQTADQVSPLAWRMMWRTIATMHAALLEADLHLWHCCIGARAVKPCTACVPVCDHALYTPQDLSGGDHLQQQQQQAAEGLGGDGESAAAKKKKKKKKKKKAGGGAGGTGGGGEAEEEEEEEGGGSDEAAHERAVCGQQAQEGCVQGLEKEGGGGEVSSGLSKSQKKRQKRKQAEAGGACVRLSEARTSGCALSLIFMRAACALCMTGAACISYAAYVRISVL
eukprot:1155264-Pelagomonas_calceolata.AAC.6